MKISKILLPVLLAMPVVAFGAVRSDSNARIGIRGVQAGARAQISAANVAEAKEQGLVSTQRAPSVAESIHAVADTGGGDCRDAYRQCMDSFCLLDESQGERCACSENINRSKSKIKEILAIQAEADKLFTEGVEREQLGAKARLVFAENSANTNVSTASFMAWLTDGEEDEDEEYEEEIGEDVVLGDSLYQMASGYCQAELAACGSKSEMESTLYSRMITQDCKSYDAYLTDQKSNAESNKRIAESAVRKARLEMLDTTNKYNRGECLLAYRSCIIDKGGCGTNFENCLDAKLLQRRANACENVLDQCMAVRDYVVQDWAAESKNVLKEAAKYADTNKRGTCLAKAQDCLEENCSTSTNSECLNDVNVAAGICPIITECEGIIPGFQSVINDKLAYLKTKFCENDIDKCLQDKCGIDFTKPECVGKKPYEIASLCPQNMFPSCNGATQYDTIVQSAILQMDYQMLQGCINYFSDQLSKVCGTDMACLPIVSAVSALTTEDAINTNRKNIKEQVIAESDAAVEEFFKQFENDKTVTACMDSQSDENKRVKGKDSLGNSVFNSAVMLAKTSAANRNIREMDLKLTELKRVNSLEEARRDCLETYKPEQPDETKNNYSYITSVSFEADLRSCHVCRKQQVCEEGGESKMSAALKSAAGGLSAGGAAGTLVNVGWGTAIGSVIGAVGAGVVGGLAGGKKEFCQEIESCEDINANIIEQ